MKFEHIGSYLIEKKIGAGGMGTVYYGRHTETGQPAAVKILLASLAREEGFVVRFAREIKSLKQLKNPHVVEFYESGVEDDNYYYAMEYVDGETLTQLLRREKRLPWRKVITFSSQICLALKAAHDAGIIHRDLKPSNLLIAQNGNVKLADFGIAQLFTANKLTATGGIIGTAEYMSPEQAQGKRVTKHSDLYSLGTVIYAMLTGQPPFNGKTALDILQKHRFGQFDRPGVFVPEIPRWLDEIVCQLLEKEPENRFHDAYVLSRRLKEVVKKVDLSLQEETIAAPSDNNSMPTAVISNETAAPGAGTWIRDSMRVETDRTRRETAIRTLFNSTWVLSFCLLLLIGGGIGWFWTSETMTDQNHRESIERKSEAERFLELARHMQRLGDSPRAEKILTSLSFLLEDGSQHDKLYALTQKRLARLQSQRLKHPNRYAMLNSAMDRADELLRANKHEEARRVWMSVIDLYKSDSGASNIVRRARKFLNEKTAVDP